MRHSYLWLLTILFCSLLNAAATYVFMNETTPPVTVGVHGKYGVIAVQPGEKKCISSLPENFLQLTLTNMSNQNPYTVPAQSNLRLMHIQQSNNALVLTQEPLPQALETYYCIDPKKVRIIENRSKKSITVEIKTKDNKNMSLVIDHPAATDPAYEWPVFRCVVLPSADVASITIQEKQRPSNKKSFTHPESLKATNWYINHFDSFDLQSATFENSLDQPRLDNQINSACRAQ